MKGNLILMSLIQLLVSGITLLLVLLIHRVEGSQSLIYGSLLGRGIFLLIPGVLYLLLAKILKKNLPWWEILLQMVFFLLLGLGILAVGWASGVNFEALPFSKPLRMPMDFLLLPQVLFTVFFRPLGAPEGEISWGILALAMVLPPLIMSLTIFRGKWRLHQRRRMRELKRSMEGK
ncbi:MAG: hypothetical protein Q4E76_06500 [Tissierellia bacterium]|nr:hypothetical protein [Tissierellia bacterium]